MAELLWHDQKIMVISGRNVIYGVQIKMFYDYLYTVFFVFLHYVHMRSVKSKVNMYLLS